MSEILEAFLNPLIEHITGGERKEQLFCKFMGRLMGERGYRLPESVEPLFQEMALRFATALRRAVPELSEEIANSIIGLQFKWARIKSNWAKRIAKTRLFF